MKSDIHKIIVVAICAIALLAYASNSPAQRSIKDPGIQKSDAINVTFIPGGTAVVQKGGPDVQFRVTFNGSTNAADGGDIKFNLVDIGADPSGALFSNITFFCSPSLPANTNFEGQFSYVVRCNANGDLVAVRITSVDIRDPNTNNKICSSGWGWTNNVIPAEGDNVFEIYLQDVGVDTEARGVQNIRCSNTPPYIPTLSQWGMVAVVLLLLLAGALHIRRRRAMAS